MSQVEQKPSGSEKWEGAVTEKGRADICAMDVLVLQTKKENNVKLTFPYFPLCLYLMSWLRAKMF